VSSRLALARARHALGAAGLNPNMPLERADSVTNEVWLAPRYVVRVNRRPDQRLHREAQLSARLPAEVGYPEIVAHGGDIGSDWVVSRRSDGDVLSRCWPTMDNDDRRDAVRQLALRLRRLHAVECPGGLPEIEAPQLLGSVAGSPVTRLLSALEAAAILVYVDRLLLADVADVVRETQDALEPFDATTLIHGDLHFQNVLWDGRSVTALLDFEWARAAPADLDLDVFLRFCAYPYLHVAEDYEHLTLAEDYERVPWWLADDYPELFEQPRQLDRVRLYSIAYDVRELLLYPPRRPLRELSEHHPHHRLARTLSGRGHLDALAATAS
jgi:hygromycin-B 7''-O-kinase